VSAEERNVFPVPEPEDEEPITEEPAGDPQTVLDAVRAEWQKQTAERTMDYEVPGMERRLVLRLGPIRGSTLTRLRERLEQSRSPERDLNLNCDVLVAACRLVLGRPGPGQDPVELGDDDGPFRLDSRLAQALGSDAQTARQVVVALFRRANVPELAVAQAASAYMEWASSADSDVAEDLLGES
jgi:hypothetical protein